MRLILYVTVSLILILEITACKKYLDDKPNQKLSTPDALVDLQAILDNNNVLNKGMVFTNNQTDEYYLTYEDWLNRPEFRKDGYIWAPTIYIPSGSGDDWYAQYEIIFHANTVLDNLKRITPNNQQTIWNSIRGQALVFRAYAFFELAQLYAPQYDSNTAGDDLGIVLRLNSDFNEISKRSTVEETYAQILDDLTEAATLLPQDVLPVNGINKTRPTLPCAYALLARVYLQQGDYHKARENSNRCLNLFNTLIEYDSYPTNYDPQFVPLNDEVIFYTNSTGTQNASVTSKIDTSLYMLYSPHDRRRDLYFTDNGDESHRFIGSYNGSTGDLFNGLATDEIYLIRAECNTRLGNVAEGLSDLNTMLAKRWKNGFFIPYTATDEESALSLILTERKKELIYRGRRWSDLKRLNKEPRFATTLQRILDNQIYTLLPNEHRYSFLIPRDVVAITGIQQNAR